MTDHPVKRRKKMIEVAIPLEAINAASAREKSIRHGHPSTLHLWWARRPLAAARSVIFCQMVDDPSAVPEEFPTEEDQENERLRLFALVSELVIWENTTNELVLNRAREEINRSWRRACADNADHPEATKLFNPDKLPGFHDPFAGGGALPLEAQRLGLEAYASDLNPVAVLINKAMIEIPPKFAGMPPVNPESRSKKELIAREWKGAQGLAEDVRYYGKWMRDEAEKRIGHLYPKIKITAEMVAERSDLKPYEGQELTVIAWIWARTVESPNPAFSGCQTPLASTLILSSKKGRETYVHISTKSGHARFKVVRGFGAEHEEAKNGTKLGKGSTFKCIYSGVPIDGNYIKVEGMAGRLSSVLMAVVLEGNRERVYVSPDCCEMPLFYSTKHQRLPAGEMPPRLTGGTCVPYGFKEWSDLFSLRQLSMLSSLCDLVESSRTKVKDDLMSANQGLTALALAEDYSSGIATYLAFAVSRLLMYSCQLCYWLNQPKNELVSNAFGRQAFGMVWDFAENNPFSGSGGNIGSQIDTITRVISTSLPAMAQGEVSQLNAASQTLSQLKVVSTDPPYYDNIAYADLSDFFYVWLKLSLGNSYPRLFATFSTPKKDELIAVAYRHQNKEHAEAFFLDGMTSALSQISAHAHPGFPVTIYYAFKQSETGLGGGTASTGWERFLEALISARLCVSGTWPVRTERPSALKSQVNALATSMVLVCNAKPSDCETTTRAAFKRLIKDLMPSLMNDIGHANIPPVDVAQAAIGPGMAIFSSAKAVLNPDDTPMTVREALIEINTALDEYLSQDEGDLDADSRFALTFFESYGYEERPYGDAEGLAIARNLSVDGVAEAGILSSVAGKVRLYQRAQLPEDWDPTTDRRLCVWEATQHLIKRLEANGENAAAELLLQLKNVSGHGDLATNCRALAYRLYNHCEKKKQAEEARSYNGLVIAWPELERLASASSTSSSAPLQTTLI